MKKDLFDLLKEFIIENANECELFPLEGGYKRLIGEKPKNYDEVINAEIEGDILNINYYDDNKEYIVISSNLLRAGEDEEEIRISRLNGKINIEATINKK